MHLEQAKFLFLECIPAHLGYNIQRVLSPNGCGVLIVLVVIVF